MKVTVNITLADSMSEEELAARWSSSAKLRELYTEAFTNILEGVRTKDTKIYLHVDVTDNTKEEPKE